jgi:hypothetical protein
VLILKVHLKLAKPRIATKSLTIIQNLQTWYVPTARKFWNCGSGHHSTESALNSVSKVKVVFNFIFDIFMLSFYFLLGLPSFLGMVRPIE